MNMSRISGMLPMAVFFESREALFRLHEAKYGEHEGDDVWRCHFSAEVHH